MTKLITYLFNHVIMNNHFVKQQSHNFILISLYYYLYSSNISNIEDKTYYSVSKLLYSSFYVITDTKRCFYSGKIGCYKM